MDEKLNIIDILKKHEAWLYKKDDGVRADLTGANLTRADLREANLTRADLREANLTRAELTRAELTEAELTRANLTEADLTRADLREANLTRADLRGAYLTGANLTRADLRGANLTGANLTRADLRGAKNVPFIPMTCPDNGSFIAWKKADGHILKLEIPEDARRSSATGRKCRCDKALVLGIEQLDGTETSLKEIASNHDPNFIYKVGELVEEPNFCVDRFQECAPGIHFFINRQEAVEY